MTAEQGDGFAVSSLDQIGEGYGFRKIRHEVGVTAFGINALVLPAGYSSGVHFHDEQQELYFVHAGRVEIRLDGETRLLGPGGFARVDPSTRRGLRNVGDSDAIVVVIGGKDGYVGRDGHPADGRKVDGPPGAH